VAKKVFISHASEDLATVARFVHLLEDGLGFARVDIKCSSLPGYGFPAGSPFRDDIRDLVESADAVVALISPAFMDSPYCLGEIGIAWGLRKQIVSLLLPNIGTSQVRGPLSGLTLKRLNNVGTLNELREQFDAQDQDSIRWEDRRDDFLTKLYGNLPAMEVWRERGFWNSRVVDGTLYIADKLLTRGLRRQVLDALESGWPVPPHLFYVTDQGAERWLALAQDPEFVAYRDSMDLVHAKAGEISQAIINAAGSKNIDFVSLGPGDGRKDASLLRSLVWSPDHNGGTIYYPFDVSTNMIAKTLERVYDDSAIRRGLAQVKAVVADFESLPIFTPVYQYREGPNVLVLLGNMLGNFADDFGFLKRLHDRAMFGNDLVLLEVRLQSAASGSSLREMKRRDWPASNRFDFGPLELLGVRFEGDKISYRFVPDRGTIRGSDTIVAQYAEAVVDGRTFRDIDLSYVHRYDQQTFLSEVARAGFEVIRTWRSPQEQNLWVLAQKTATAPIP
jgi:hypothetical protein